MAEEIAVRRSAHQAQLARRALAVTAGTQVLLSLVVAIAPVIAPEIAPRIGLGPERVGVFNAVIYLSAITSSFFISPWIAWLGPVRTTRVILIGIGAGVAVATVGNAASLLLAAAVIGATLSCPNPTFSAILGRYAPPRSIGLYLSVRYAASPAGIALTGVLLPLAITRAGWRGSLWIVAAGCIAAGMAVGRAIPSLDWRSSQRPANGNPATSLLTVLRRAPLRRLSLVALAYSMLQQGFLAFSVLILVRQGIPLKQAAGLLALSQVVSFIARVGFGHAVDRWITPRSALSGHGIAMGIACLWLAWLPASPSLALATGVMIASGTLTTAWVALLFTQLMRVARLDEITTVASGIQVFTFAGSVLGPLLLAVLLEHGVAHGIVLTGLSALAAIAGASLLAHGPSRAAEREQERIATTQ